MPQIDVTFDIDANGIVNVSAKSFLHSQVRIMAGTLVEVGKGKFNSSNVDLIAWF